MELSKKLRADIKIALETEHGRPFSDDEVEKVAEFMKQLAEMQIEIFLEDQDRQRRLAESPGGFHLEKKGYSCRICGGAAHGENSWFDEHGLKCWTCQQAINEKIVPPTVIDKDTWYSPWELEQYFGLKGQALRRWEKKGLLVSRTINREGKRGHLTLFLLQDNAAMLPPKALVQPEPVIETIDGREWHTSRPWYQFVDPYMQLKGYKILEYLKFVQEENPDVAPPQGL